MTTNERARLVAWPRPPAIAETTTTRLTADQLLTASQLATRWQVPASHVYRLTREGKLPAVKLGRYWRYRRDQIEQWELARFDIGREGA